MHVLNSSRSIRVYDLGKMLGGLVGEASIELLIQVIEESERNDSTLAAAELLSDAEADGQTSPAGEPPKKILARD